MLGLSLAVLQPHYTWPCRPISLAFNIPKTPQPTHWIISRFWSRVHKLLKKFSKRYCRWMGQQWNPTVCDLPFGLILKWSDGTRLEEALTMQVARAGGIPVPKLICYGEHSNMDHAPVSILMTRMPGDTLYEELWNWYSPEQRATIISELKTYLATMRSWCSPWNPPTRICAASGGDIRSLRVPQRLVGPYNTEKEFNDYLEAPVIWDRETPLEEYEKLEADVQRLHLLPHKIVFTHGDIAPWNILVHNGHVSAILDWEASGWYPDYWEYTTGWRISRPGQWWYEFMKELADGKYLVERKGDMALRTLTSHVLIG